MQEEVLMICLSLSCGEETGVKRFGVQDLGTNAALRFSTNQLLSTEKQGLSKDFHFLLPSFYLCGQ